MPGAGGQGGQVAENGLRENSLQAHLSRPMRAPAFQKIQLALAQERGALWIAHGEGIKVLCPGPAIDDLALGAGD